MRMETTTQPSSVDALSHQHGTCGNTTDQLFKKNLAQVTNRRIQLLPLPMRQGRNLLYSFIVR